MEKRKKDGDVKKAMQHGKHSVIVVFHCKLKIKACGAYKCQIIN